MTRTKSQHDWEAMLETVFGVDAESAADTFTGNQFSPTDPRHEAIEFIGDMLDVLLKQDQRRLNALLSEAMRDEAAT